MSGQDASILVGTADVASGDEFEAVAGTTTWRYVYARRRYNATAGWRRYYVQGDLEIFGAYGVVMSVSGTRVRAAISGTSGARTWTFTDL